MKLNQSLMDLATPKVMGILNVTPDSFYDGGMYSDLDQIKTRLLKMVDEGADIIDIGAYSSRPNAADVSVDEETERIDQALQMVSALNINIPISIDTFRSEVAEFALEKYQVEIINDISAGEMDEAMFDVIAKYQPVYMMMHMRGTPQTMTELTVYDDLISELIQYFSKKIELLKQKGVKDIVIDPGFGFAKTLDQNYELLRNLHLFSALEVPILVGMSRKSMLYKLLEYEPDDALNATTIVNTLALTKGADILRVHDVKAAKECVTLFCKADF